MYVKMEEKKETQNFFREKWNVNNDDLNKPNLLLQISLLRGTYYLIFIFQAEDNFYST